MSTSNYSHGVVASRLRRWRLRSSLTQQDLAAVLYLHREAISDLEHGRRKLTFVEANVLRLRLGLTWPDLVS